MFSYNRPNRNTTLKPTAVIETIGAILYENQLLLAKVTQRPLPSKRCVVGNCLQWLKPNTLTRNPDFTLLFYSPQRSLLSTRLQSPLFYILLLSSCITVNHLVPKFKAIRFPRVECHLTLTLIKNHPIYNKTTVITIHRTILDSVTTQRKQMTQ